MDRETKPAVEYLRETIDDVRLVQQVARISFGHDVGDIKAAEMGKTKKTRKKSAEAAEAHSTKGIKSKHTPRKKAQESEVLSARERREKQPREPPSEESGGVPEASAAYLAQAARQPLTLPQPRRILLVLDLNGTLLYRPIKRRPFHFVERPYASHFLGYCLDTFHVAIWSSARPDNVGKMVDQLLGSAQRARCVVVWARDKFGLSPANYDARVQCYKRLQHLWDDPAVRASHPDASHGGRWDQSNTVLVDDSPEKGRSEPFNILPIPEFSGVANETAEVLPQVHDYLNSLCWQADVSTYIRQTPFRLDPSYTLESEQIPTSLKTVKQGHPT